MNNPEPDPFEGVTVEQMKMAVQEAEILNEEFFKDIVSNGNILKKPGAEKMVDAFYKGKIDKEMKTY